MTEWTAEKQRGKHRRKLFEECMLLTMQSVGSRHRPLALITLFFCQARSPSRPITLSPAGPEFGRSLENGSVVPAVPEVR